MAGAATFSRVFGKPSIPAAASSFSVERAEYTSSGDTRILYRQADVGSGGGQSLYSGREGLSVDDCKRQKLFNVLSVSVVASLLFGVSQTSERLSLLDLFRSFFITDHRFEPFCLQQIS